MAFKTEGEIFTLEEVHEAEERGNCSYHFRLTTLETGEVFEWLSPTKINAFQYLFIKLSFFEVDWNSLKMVRLVSDAAFTAALLLKIEWRI